MIVHNASGEGDLHVWDGETIHPVAHDDFAPMKVHSDGGIHPAITDEFQTWLQVPPGTYDFSSLPKKLQPVTIVHDMLPVGKSTQRYIKTEGHLQAKYGPDDHIVTVPLNGDAAAQHLHWLHRDEQGRAEMRAILDCLHAWRLMDDGSLPDGEGEYPDHLLHMRGEHAAEHGHTRRIVALATKGTK